MFVLFITAGMIRRHASSKTEAFVRLVPNSRVYAQMNIYTCRHLTQVLYLQLSNVIIL